MSCMIHLTFITYTITTQCLYFLPAMNALKVDTPTTSKMASKDTTLEYNFVEKPSRYYFCPVTFEILTDPQQTNFCCRNQLSRAAANRLKQEGKPCPICGFKPLKTTDDPYLRRKVMALKVRCSNSALGCEWVGALGQLEEHMKVGSLERVCEYASVPCRTDMNTKSMAAFARRV